MTVLSLFERDLFPQKPVKPQHKPDITSIDGLILYIRDRSPPLSVEEHREVSLIAVQLAYKDGDLGRAQAHLKDALNTAHNSSSVCFQERCLYWQAVLMFSLGKALESAQCLSSLLSRQDLPLDLQAYCAALFASVLTCLPQSLDATLLIPHVVHKSVPAHLRLVKQATPETSLFTSIGTELFPNETDEEVKARSLAQTAHAFCYFARLAESMASPDLRIADLAQAHICMLFESSDSFAVSLAENSPQNSMLKYFTAKSTKDKIKHGNFFYHDFMMGCGFPENPENPEPQKFQNDPILRSYFQVRRNRVTKLKSALKSKDGQTWKFLLPWDNLVDWESTNDAVMDAETVLDILPEKFRVFSLLTEVDCQLLSGNTNSAISLVSDILQISISANLQASFTAGLLRLFACHSQTEFQSQIPRYLDSLIKSGKLFEHISGFLGAAEISLYHRLIAMSSRQSSESHEIFLDHMRQSLDVAQEAGHLVDMEITAHGILGFADSGNDGNFKSTFSSGIQQIRECQSQIRKIVYSRISDQESVLNDIGYLISKPFFKP